MHKPSNYEYNKPTVDYLNAVYIPNIINAMSWNFSGGNILDFGCGPGGTGNKYILPQAESTNSQMYSVDISSNMVEFARNNFSSTRTHYAVGTMPNNFPFPSVAFDKVFAVNVLHKIKDVRPTLQGIMNILKPGGQFGFNNSTVISTPFKMMRAVATSKKWGKYLREYLNYGPEWTNYGQLEPEQYFKQLFSYDMGFEQIHFDFSKFEKVQNLQVDAFLDFVITVTPCIDNLPEELLGDFKEEYRRSLTTMYGIPLDSTSFDLEIEYMGVVLQKPLN